MTDLLMKSLLHLLSPGGKRGRLSILIYHRVLDAPDPFAPWAIGAEAFECHMKALSRYFTVIPLPEAISRLSTGELPPRAACVTFDDGYRDNLTIALPILQRHAIPATVFVASGFLDGGRMWNDTITETLRAMPDGELDLADLNLGRYPIDDKASRLRAMVDLLPRIKYLPHDRRLAVAEQIGDRAGADLPSDLMLSSEAVEILHASGVTIGGHTLNHPILAGLDDEAAQREISENRVRLTEITGKPLSVFAYPNGRPGRDYTAAHVRMVRDCGYLGAVSTAAGVATCGVDPYQLPRFTPWDGTPGRFTLRLARNMIDKNPSSVAG